MNCEKVSNSVIYNANALDVLDFMISEGQTADMIFTDPPYKMTSRGGAGGTGGMFRKDLILKGQVFEHNSVDIEDYLPRLYKVLKRTGHCYIMANNKNLTHFLKVIDEWKDADDKDGFHFIKCLIWNKGNKVMGQFYMSQYEYILFLRKGAAVRINDCGTSDILCVPSKKAKGVDGKNIHDTEKPVDLCKIIIENSSQTGETVLDPFMGIGGCGVAARELGRRFVGVEINSAFYNVAKERISNAKYFEKTS